MGFTQSFQSWFKKFLDLIRGKVPVTQSFTVNKRQDFKNRMTRSTPCPVVLRQARGKLPGLVVPSAIHGTFRKIKSFREQDLHPMNIVDLDIGPHQRTMKHTFSTPNLIKDYSFSYTSRRDPSIREEFDFTAGISNYLLMTEQEAQTD